MWSGNAFGINFWWVEVISDNRSGGWRLTTDVGVQDYDPDITSAQYQYTSGGGFNSMTHGTWGYPGGADWREPYYTFYEDPDVLTTAGWSTPDDAEGKTFTWEVYENSTSVLDASGVVPSEINQVPLSTNLQLVSGGLNPTISWHNDGPDIDYYRVRLLDDANQCVWQDNVSYSADASYTFSDYTLTFGESYWFRVEARQDTIPFDSWSGDYQPYIFNRSAVYSDEYVATPIPGSVLLLGSGLFALLGFRRKFRKN